MKRARMLFLLLVIWPPLLTGFDVFDRRARGETIQVAQSFFETPMAAGRARPQFAQGDKDEAAMKIVLASTAPPMRASKIEIAEPRKASAKGKWTVQVGSFSSRADAREQLAIVEKKFGKHFDKANGVAEKDGGKYRSRFSGFTETSAKAACQALKAKKQPCMVISPSA